MGNTNKFWRGILAGAVAGGALSLLDRETRQSVVAGMKKTTKNVSYAIKHPEKVVEHIQESTHKLRSTVEQVSDDITFIAAKVEELREITPSVAGIVKDTKEVFLKDGQEEEHEPKQKLKR